MFVQSFVLGLSRSMIFFINSAGYSFGAFLVIEGRATFDEIIRCVKDLKKKFFFPFFSMILLSSPPLSPTPLSDDGYTCRVFAAMVFTAMSLGRATSYTPDATKSKMAAARIMALLGRKPTSDASSTEGLKLVS